MNNSAIDGGTIYILFSSNVVIQSCVVSHSIGITSGGALSIIHAEKLIARESVFSNCFSSYSFGGGVYLRDSRGAVFAHCNFSSNWAAQGGGLYISQSNDAVLMSNRFTNNVAAFEGGAVWSDEVVGTSVQDCHFSRNVAHAGAAVLLFRNTRISFEESVFRSNVALQGGTIYSERSQAISVQNSLFLNNKARIGGSIYAEFTPGFAFRDSQWLNNAADNQGGAMALLKCNSSIFTRTNFTGNTATNAGGGIFSQASNVTISKSVFVRNEVLKGSGSALFWSKGILNISNETLFLGNSALMGGGTVFWDSFPFLLPPILDESTLFIRNTAKYGETTASGPYELQITNSGDIVVTDYEFNFAHVSVALKDYYGNIVKSNSVYYITMATIPESCEAEGSIGVLSGTLQQRLQEGESEFTTMQAYCYPGYSIALLASASFEDLVGEAALEVTSTIYFLECSIGEVVVNGVCRPCQNSFSFESGAITCRECPEHTSYCERNSIWVKEGFWRISDATTTMLACPLGTDGCRGGNSSGNAMCNAGYQDALCAVCSSGYAFQSWSRTCEECSDSFDYIAAVVPVTLIALFLIYLSAGVYDSINFSKECGLFTRAMLMLGLQDAGQGDTGMLLLLEKFRYFRTAFFARIKVHATFYQILLAAPFVFDVSLPLSYSFLLDTLSWLGIHVAESSGMTCLWEMDYVDELIVQTLLPFVISALILAAYYLHVFYYRQKGSDDAEWLEAKLSFLSNTYSTLLLTVVYLLLTATVTVIFRMYPCDDVDPDDKVDGKDLFMRADYSISCSSDRYILGVAWASCMAIVYCIGVPLFYGYLLFSAKDDILMFQKEKDGDKRKIIDRRLAPIKFLFAAYKPQYWYWELLDTLQRIILAGVLCVVWSGSTWQVIIGIAIMIGFIKLYSRVDPYVSVANSMIKSGTQLQVFSVYFIILLIRQDTFSSGFSHSALQALLVLASVANLLYELTHWVYLALWEWTSDQKTATASISYVTHERRVKDCDENDKMDDFVIENPLRTSVKQVVVGTVYKDDVELSSFSTEL